MSNLALKSNFKPNREQFGEPVLGAGIPEISEDIIRPFKGQLPRKVIAEYLARPEKGSSSYVINEDLLTETFPLKAITKDLVPSLGMSPVARNQFVSLQKWQGVVIEINKDSFFAKLTDQIEKGVEEIAEISTDEVSDEDIKLMTPGAVFYWNIGYQISYQGQQTRVSIIRFRRLPMWRSEELNVAKRCAEDIQNIINWK